MRKSTFRSWAVATTAGTAAAALAAAREYHARVHAERLSAALLETLLGAIDANDPETGAHVRRVARYALILADAADLDEAAQRSVERVALFHDIGKIDQAMFDIVHEESQLSDADRRSIAQHPALGAEVLAPLATFYPELPDGVLSHHERWDGTGYPRKLKGEAIPIAARIVAIADSFDAITHARRYRPGRSAHEGAVLIGEGWGTQFDPTLTDLFLMPPVFEAVEQQRDEAQRTTSESGGRRQTGAVEDGPDVSFRWRTAGREQQT